MLATHEKLQTADCQELCLHYHFETQARQIPDRIAVVCGDEQLSYGELNRRANQLAHYLKRLGVGPETAVGLCVQRSVDLAVALLGLLKAGGVCVLIDPALPQKRQAFMLEDTAAAVLITQTHFRHQFSECNAFLVCLDELPDKIIIGDEDNVAGSVTADNAAFIIYTSGSTGTPKGVILTHAGECGWELAAAASYPLTQADAFLITTYSAAGDMFWPWFCGSQVIMAEEGYHQDSGYLVDLIIKKQVTFAYFAPSMLWMLLEEAQFGSSVPLREVRCGGEPLPLELQERFFNRLQGRLHNYYALSEAGSIIWDCQRGHQYQTVPIGRPVSHTHVYLLDADLQPVPAGKPGEIYLGGSEMARGYLNRRGLTAVNFLPNPFSDLPGSRMFKTGDLARCLPDGNFEFLGRADYQVQVRGFRIELGEIEAVLMQHPGVRKAVVMALDDIYAAKRLVAYIVPQRQHPAPPYNQLREFLQEKLPEYMIPAALVQLESLPLTPNGKVDRHRLPRPDRARPALAVAFAPPHSPAEEVVAQIWSQILGIDPVGIQDDFFQLGGHSLLATRMVSLLEDIFRVRVPLRTVFEAPSVAGIVAVLGNFWGDLEVVDEIAQTWQELATLSEDQVKAMLQEANSGENNG